ncbi:hypothetical protein MLD38_018405 [Melastoma candidum]|uniref:Uncharacterized protein n=1 Tax=Melastoma candidum TaxID=119954 RepID=A0ACB9QTL5_9MYRT|nr:hypothetical protein MLD38_018405 [Melastoma candidum]
MDLHRSSPLVALALSINLLCFALTGACTTCTQPKPIPNPYLTPSSPSSSFPKTPNNGKSCPRDALKLGICAKVLNGPVNAVIGTPPDMPCCTLLDGLLDLEAAICLCTAIKANILGINLNIPISLSLLVNTCGKKVPSNFQCA